MLAAITYEHTVAALMIWLGLVAAALTLAYGVWRHLRIGVTSLALSGIRLAFILLMVWCLFQPTSRETETEILKPRFLVALDTSGSMQLSPGENAASRWVKAQAALADSWTRSLGSGFEIDLCEFAGDLGERKTLADGGKAAPGGQSTLLRDALERLNDRYRGQNVGGMLLLSDGIDTREANDLWAAAPWSWPIFTLRLESEGGWKIEPDVRIDSVNTPRRVNVGWASELKAVVSGEGTRGEPIAVQLLKEGALADETSAQIPAEGGAKEVTFALRHPEIGVFDYTVRLPPLPGENRTNMNEYAVTVQVVDAKNRLLYVEGPPRWESKFLSRTLQANKQVTAICFIRGPDGKFLTFGPRGGITTDMTEAQLAMFKIVILGNLDAGELGPERAANLLRFVDLGGSLVLLGGPKGWGRNGFDNSDLKKLLPAARHGTVPVEGKFALALTDEGRMHSAFLGDESVWAALPPVLSVFPDVEPAPGAAALVTVNTGKGNSPVLMSHRYGEGKVVALFTDSLWRWQLNPDPDKPYQRFWDQLLDWLCPSERDLSDQELELSADKERLAIGDEIELTARFGAGAQATNATITCNVLDPDGRTTPFAMSAKDVTTLSGRKHSGYSFNFTGRIAGGHKAVAVAELGGRRLESAPLSFHVKPVTPELAPRPANIPLLKALSANSGGAFYDDSQRLNDALSSLSAGKIEEVHVKYRSLWNEWLTISLLLGLLSVEWLVRKLRGLP